MVRWWNFDEIINLKQHFSLSSVLRMFMCVCVCVRCLEYHSNNLTFCFLKFCSRIMMMMMNTWIFWIYISRSKKKKEKKFQENFNVYQQQCWWWWIDDERFFFRLYILIISIIVVVVVVDFVSNQIEKKTFYLLKFPFIYSIEKIFCCFFKFSIVSIYWHIERDGRGSRMGINGGWNFQFSTTTFLFE